MSRFYVGSEIGQLRSVLLHRPQLSLSRLTPDNCDQLLFDDVLAVDKAGREHDAFADTLRREGVEVLLLHELLAESLESPEAREFLLGKQLSPYRLGEQLAADVRDWLQTLPAHKLAKQLIGGLTFAEYPGRRTSLLQWVQQEPTEHPFIIEPLPNHLFTRDTSCWIYGGVSLNPMMKPARQRETFNLQAIYRYHPRFAAQHRPGSGQEERAGFETYLGGNGQLRYDNSYIEGGDVLVTGNGTVLIGISERTTPQGAELLARRLFTSGQAAQVLILQLPLQRACMHLDTVLTQMSHSVFSYYPAVLNQSTRCWSLTPGTTGQESLQIRELPSFQSALEQAVGGPVTLIPTGGDSFQAAREQWNDANNVLAVRPGVVIGYQHNHYTNEACDKAGITVLPIPGDELGKGRGGARCMSCPLSRDAV